MEPGVYLIRHPKTALNTDGRSPDKIRGWKDVPLDGDGKKQVPAIASFIARVKPVKIYSSDLERALVPAKEASKRTGVPLEKDKQFRPWNLGKLQGSSAAAAVPVIKEHVKNPSEPVPDGESFNAYRDRYVGALKKVLNEYLRTDETVVIVSHFRNLKFAEAWLAKGASGKEIDEKVFEKDDVPTGGIMRVFRKAGRWAYEMLESPSISEGKVGIKKPDQDAKRIGVRQLRAG